MSKVTVPFEKRPLLSSNNNKTMKGEKYGYFTYILYMAPYTDNARKINVCPFASKGCAAACLVGSGFGGIYKTVADSRRNRTEYWLSDRKSFLNQLDLEIASKIKRHSAGKHEGLITIRLNGTSDISYEKFEVRDGKNIFELYPEITFYDYTKNWKRFNTVLPANYHLTFSRAENNEDKALEVLSKGYNVAVVFKGGLPATWKGYEVIDGDKNDLRFTDGSNVVVGLKYKQLTGKGADNKAGLDLGFVVDVSQDAAIQKVA